MNAVSVILPSYNESHSIIEAIDRISKSLSNYSHEIIVVDDNSPDGTSKLVKDYQHPNVRLITRVDEKGLASALHHGLQIASGRLIVWLDCDLGILPEDIPRLLDILPGNDLVIASRYLPTANDHRPTWRASLSYIVNCFARLLLGSAITDYSSGFIALRSEVLKSVDINPNCVFGEYFIEFVYHCKCAGYRITELPYQYYDRPSGISKSSDSPTTIIKLGWAYGIKILQLRFFPKLYEI